jgi:hypothetical protein
VSPLRARVKTTQLYRLTLINEGGTPTVVTVTALSRGVRTARRVTLKAGGRFIVNRRVRMPATKAIVGIRWTIRYDGKEIVKTARTAVL